MISHDYILIWPETVRHITATRHLTGSIWR